MIDWGSQKEVKEWYSGQYFKGPFQMPLGQNYKIILSLLFV